MALVRTQSTDSDLEPLYYDGRLRNKSLKNFLAGVFIGSICFIAIIALVITVMKIGQDKSRPAIVINVSPVINISCGLIQGRREDGVLAFRVSNSHNHLKAVSFLNGEDFYF